MTTPDRGQVLSGEDVERVREKWREPVFPITGGQAVEAGGFNAVPRRAHRPGGNHPMITLPITIHRPARDLAVTPATSQRRDSEIFWVYAGVGWTEFLGVCRREDIDYLAWQAAGLTAPEGT